MYGLTNGCHATVSMSYFDMLKIHLLQLTINVLSSINAKIVFAGTRRREISLKIYLMSYIVVGMITS